MNRLDALIGNLNLATKFAVLFILVIPIFLIGVTLTGFTLRDVLSESYKSQVTERALLAMDTMDSVREYTSSQVKPELIDRLEKEFLPQSVPAYSATEVFRDLQQKPDYENFFYKEATLNPTNPRDQADEFETEVVQAFRENPDLKEKQDFRSFQSEETFYIAHPLKVSKSSCLECHGAIKDAPQSMIDEYGTEGGFNWELNEIVGAQIVYVPASEIHQQTQKAVQLTIGFVVTVLVMMAVTVALINFSLYRYVINPIKQMSGAADAISKGDLTVEFRKRYNDEVGRLAEAFTRMKTSLAMAMKRLKNKE